MRELCATCDFWKPDDDGFGFCTNPNGTHKGYATPDSYVCKEWYMKAERKKK